MKHLFKSLAIAGVLVSAVACKDSTSPMSKSPKLGNMKVGEMRIIPLPMDEDGLTVPQDMQSAEYLVVLTSVGPEDGTQEVFDIAGNQIPGESIGTTSDFTQVFKQQRVQAAFEDRMREEVRQHLTVPSTDEFSVRLNRSAQAMNVPADVAVGAQVSIGVRTGCADPVTNTVGRVEYVSQRAVIVMDNAVTSSYRFSTSELKSIGDRFDDVIYKVNEKYFGTPTDIDGNGRVILYYTPQVNALTTNPNDGFVAGFFAPWDLVPSSVCSANNDGEIFYLLAPAPSWPSKADVLGSTEGTIAHEFQHMINAGTRFYRTRTGIQEAGWLDEALAHFAEDAVGRVLIGKGDLAPVTLPELYDIQESLEYENYFLQNLARAKLYLADMRNGSPIGREALLTSANHGLKVRGAAWAFLRYLADWHSGNNPAKLTKGLVQSPDTGVKNIVGETGVPLELMLGRFLATLYTDGMGIAGLAKQFNYRSYEFRAAITGLPRFSGMGSYGITPYPLGNGLTETFRTVYRGSGAYFILDQQSSGQRLVTIGGASEYGRAVVIRLK